MRAVVLVGGEGTRLRPLTETIPKPLIPLVDRPFLAHVLDHLGRHAVDHILLSSPYLEEAFRPFLASRLGSPEVTWISEPEPLGTGGAVANAVAGLTETVVVRNGDILTDLDVTAMVARHRARGAVATIALARVEDARPYGLVSVGPDDRVLEFREKPSDPVPGLVNTGTYVLEPGALEGVARDLAVSIEREVFPQLIERTGAVSGFVSGAYWADLGTPATYLRATFDALDGRVEGLSYQAPFVHPDAAVSLRARLGRWVVIGPSAAVEADAEVEDSVVLEGAVLERGVRVRDSIVGPRSRIGAGAVLADAVLAEGASVVPGISAEGARVGAAGVLEG